MKKIFLTFLILTTTSFYSQTSLDFDQYVNFIDNKISFEANLLLSKGWQFQGIDKENKSISLKRTHKEIIKEICTFYGYGDNNRISSIWVMVTSDSIYRRYLDRLKYLGFKFKKEYNEGFKLVKIYENKLKGLHLRITIEIENDKLTIFNFLVRKL
ncbi:hypothetical protein [Tenacibaculum ovolyticum]|uniref:hypothetical protein n=1 Tax=Tenacibaculum ovolyticum TaxID=104270 RepID=UPI003BAD9984